MTKQSLVSKTKLSDVIKTDAAVDMNSIVAYFISKYENTLLDTKKQLSEQILKKNAYLSGDFVTEVEKDVKLESYIITIKVLNTTTTASVSIDQSEIIHEKRVRININSAEKSDCRVMGCKSVKISDDLHKKYMETTTEIKALRTQLAEALDKLSTISRKERELRGALAEKTLRESGLGELLQDEALLGLVSLPQLSLKQVQ